VVELGKSSRFRLATIASSIHLTLAAAKDCLQNSLVAATRRRNSTRGHGTVATTTTAANTITGATWRLVIPNG
jgi:hypothetical protein